MGSTGSNITQTIPYTSGYMQYRDYIENDNASTEVYFDKSSRGIAFGNSEAPQTPFLDIELHSSFNTDAIIKQELKRRYPNKTIYVIDTRR